MKKCNWTLVVIIVFILILPWLLLIYKEQYVLWITIFLIVYFFTKLSIWGKEDKDLPTKKDK